MGDFWIKYKLKNGQAMNQRQIQWLDALEEEISYFESRIEQCVEAIECIKQGGKRKAKKSERDEF